MPWSGSGLSVLPRSSGLANLVSTVAMLNGVGPLRGGAKWEVLRSLEMLPWEGIEVVLMGRQVALLRRGWYKDKDSVPSPL